MEAYADPALRAIDDFQGARSDPTPEGRLREVRKRAARLRERMLSARPVRYFASRALVRVPYPTRYALLNACSVPTPLLHIVNRVFLVQTDTPHGLRTIVYSPSDVAANKETPFFRRLASSFGPFQSLGERLFAPTLTTVEAALEQAGLAPEDVDYISYDHLHTQDVRRWLGTRGSAGYFPRAKLLVMQKEWDSTRGLLPPQRDWYCPGGIDGVDPSRVVLLDGDTMLGDAVLLMRTPGHTEGNHSFVTRTPEGLMVTSENGVAPECYAPLCSRIPGVRDYARKTGMEVILNGNTLELGLDQYISMVQEKEVAGPSQRNPDFPNMVCSSELGGWWAFPGIEPTFSFGDLAFGAPVRRHERAAPTAAQPSA